MLSSQASNSVVAHQAAQDDCQIAVKCAFRCARISLVFSAGEIPALERVKPAHQESSLGHMEETT